MFQNTIEQIILFCFLEILRKLKMELRTDDPNPNAIGPTKKYMFFKPTNDVEQILLNFIHVRLRQKTV